MIWGSFETAIHRQARGGILRNGLVHRAPVSWLWVGRASQDKQARRIRTEPSYGTARMPVNRDDYVRSMPPEWSHLPLKLRWLKPTLFFVTTSLGIYAVSAYFTNRQTDVYLTTLVNSDAVCFDEDNRYLRGLKYANQQQMWLEALNNALPLSSSLDPRVYAALRHPLVFLRANAKPEVLAIALMLPLALAWQIPRLRTSMFRHWTYSIRSRKSYTMLTAIFSHQLPFQLTSFVAAWATIPIATTWFMDATDSVQYETTPWFHMAAFCLSAGMFSFLAPQWVIYLRFRSAFHKLARGVPSPYANLKINKALSYNLGISGIVHACLTLSICSDPDTPASALAPAVSRGTFWSAVCAVEAACMLVSVGHVGWASNLCGVAFGAAYSAFGPSFWVSIRMLMHRMQFPTAWELKPGQLGSHPYPGKCSDDPHPLFKRSFGVGMGWN